MAISRSWGTCNYVAEVMLSTKRLDMVRVTGVYEVAPGGITGYIRRLG